MIKVLLYVQGEFLKISNDTSIEDVEFWTSFLDRNDVDYKLVYVS